MKKLDHNLPYAIVIGLDDIRGIYTAEKLFKEQTLISAKPEIATMQEIFRL